MEPENLSQSAPDPSESEAPESSEGSWECHHCHATLNEDDECIQGADNESCCEECWDDQYFRCHSCECIGDQSDREDAPDGHSYCEECFSEHFWTCDDCGSTFASDRESPCSDPSGDGTFCHDCWSESFFYCESCGEEYDNDEYSSEGRCRHCCEEEDGPIQAEWHLIADDAIFFPELPGFDVETWDKAVDVDTAALLSGLKRVVVSTDQDADAKKYPAMRRFPAMTGVLFELRPDRLRLIATDGKRLSAQTIILDRFAPSEPVQTAVLDSSEIKPLMKFLGSEAKASKGGSISLGLSADAITMMGSDRRTFAQPGADCRRFPKFEDIISQADGAELVAVFDASDLAAALKTLPLKLDDGTEYGKDGSGNYSTDFTLAADSIEVATVSGGSTRFPASTDRPGPARRLNRKWLAEAAKAMHDTGAREVVLRLEPPKEGVMGTSYGPAFLETDGLLYVQMPLSRD